MIKNLFFLISIYFFVFAISKAQNNQLFLENFETGGNSFTLNSGGVGSSTGTNQWLINNEYDGKTIYPNTTTQDNTFNNATISFAPKSYYLHINDVATSNVLNCNYNHSKPSDQFSFMRDGVCTMGYKNVYFSFFYLCEGSTTAYGEVYYSIDGGPWIKTGNLSKYNNKSKWQYETFTDKAFSNVRNLRFGFRWLNDSTTTVNSQAFAIDDITIVGFYDNIVSPVTVTTTVFPDTVCQGKIVYLGVQLSDTLCDWEYRITISDASGNFSTNPITSTFVISYPDTFSYMVYKINKSYPEGGCYKIRVDRLSLPTITGIASGCFAINNKYCEDSINTLQPVITYDTNAICTRDVIMVPFRSWGIYNYNTYTAQLSDSDGTFPQYPTVIGSKEDSKEYPSIPPGSVSGSVPEVAPGCNYYVRVVASDPVVIGTPWGPFCIQKCDIKTNNYNSIKICLNPTDQPWDTLIPVNINIYTDSAHYLTIPDSNKFEVELKTMTTFKQVNLGSLGTVTAVNDTLMKFHVPNVNDLTALLGPPPWNYYMRIIASNSSVMENSLGTIVLLSIGYYTDNGTFLTSWREYNSIWEEDSAFCYSDLAKFTLFPYNPYSTYLWRAVEIDTTGKEIPASGINGGNPYTNPNTYDPSTGYISFGDASSLPFVGTMRLKLLVQENNNGCVGPWSPPIIVSSTGRPEVTIDGPAYSCMGDTNRYKVPFANDTYYRWTNDYGAILDTANNEIRITFDTSGTYHASVIAVNRCASDSATKTITVKAYPKVNAGNDTTVCSGKQVTLNTPLTPSSTYSWSDGTNIIGNKNSLNISPLITTTYTVSVATILGKCTKEDTVMVTVEMPVTEKQPSQIICPGENITLSIKDTEATDYLWEWNGATSSEITVSDTGIYSVSFMLPASICPKISTFEITFKVCTINLDLPNVFTPNDDDKNNFFTPIITGAFDAFNIKIYNRWGNLVYESNDPFFKWDGKNQNTKKDCPDGVYYYIIETIFREDYKKLNGHITLIR